MREFPEVLAQVMWDAYKAQADFPRGTQAAFFEGLEVGALYGRIHAEAESAEAAVEAVHDAAVAIGRRGGLKGGRARAEALSDERRSEIARDAARARWDGRP